ncbi:MAG TPA: hypothetical protein VIV54_13580 [Burkholderiales bacterium]
MTTGRCLAAAMALACSSAFADCEPRDGTPAEFQHKARVSAALKEAFPAAPANWTMSLKDIDAAPDVCKENRIGQFTIERVATYKYTPTKEETAAAEAESRKLRKEIETLRELPPEVKKERQVWLDKMSEANRASNAAYKAGDKALARKKSEEGDGYSAKGREIRDRYWASVQPKVSELEARANSLRPAGKTVTVRAIANDMHGTRTPRPEMGAQFTAGKVPVRDPGLKLQGVILLVEGTPQDRREIEAAVDRKKLERLVQ